MPRHRRHAPPDSCAAAAVRAIVALATAAWGPPTRRGIAGHTFRFDYPAAWHCSITSEFDVIRVPTLIGTPDYEWILCLPILTSPDGTPIGVFGFAGMRDPNTETTNRLAAFAQQIAQRDPSVNTEGFDRFWYVLNASFWHGLADAARVSRLDFGIADMAQECSAAFLALGWVTC